MLLNALLCGMIALSGSLFFYTTVSGSVPKAPAEIIGRSPTENHASKDSQAQPLAPGSKVEQEIAGGQIHRYRMNLKAGQFINFQIEKLGINILSTFKDPAGDALFTASFEELEYGTEVVALIAKQAGDYLLEIEPSFKKAPRGRYSVKMEEPRMASEDDQRRFLAQSAFLEAVKLNKNGSQEQRQEAQKRLAESLPLWRSLEDRVWEARTIFWQGWIYFWMTEFGPSLESLMKGLELRKANRDVLGEAEVMRTIGIVLTYRGEYPKARDYFEQALSIYQQHPERWQRGFTVLELGKIFWRLGDGNKADQLFEESFRWFREVGAEESEAEALASYSFLLLTRGNLQPALVILDRALPLFRALGNGYGEALCLNNLGIVYYNLGEPEKAYEHFSQSLARAREKNVSYNEPYVLVNMGIIVSAQGRKEKAIEHFNQALGLMKAIPNHPGVANLLRHMGQAYLDSRKLPEALDHVNRALEMARKQNNSIVEAAALTNLGEIQAAMGDREKAIETLTQALPLRRRVRDGIGVPATLYALARIERERGNLEQSLGYLEEVVSIVDSRRATVAGTELRISYLAFNQEYYEEYIDLLMQLHEQRPGVGYDALALQASERARARALLDSMVEGRADIRQGCDPALLERERTLQRQISVKDAQRAKLLSAPRTPEQIAAADRAVEALITELQQVQAQIRATSPRYAALTQPQPLDLNQMQALLDPETLLLVYRLGKRRSFLWVVSPRSLKSFDLSGQEDLVREAEQFHRALMKPPPDKASDEGEAAAGQRLFDRLLGRAAGEFGHKRLVVVADGALYHAPFAALINPETGRRLITEHELVSLPSISALALLRRDLEGRTPAPKTLAVIADPVFELQDDRIKTKATAPTYSSEILDPRRTAVRSAQESDLQIFRRLKLSREEANQITRLTPPSMHVKLMDFAASRATFEKMDLRLYRIIHLATHGVMNPKTPELSGLVLSLYDENGQPQNGFLRAHEIYNLKLGADLVVLSACQTALGKEVRGEGILGLARGFMYAGAPRLVASLWKVDDEATARLMTRFYQGMLVDRLSPAAALRKAQTEMQSSRNLSHPYYWAGFVLQGEWK